MKPNTKLFFEGKHLQEGRNKTIPPSSWTHLNTALHRQEFFQHFLPAITLSSGGEQFTTPVFFDLFHEIFKLPAESSQWAFPSLPGHPVSTWRHRQLQGTTDSECHSTHSLLKNPLWNKKKTKCKCRLLIEPTKQAQEHTQKAKLPAKETGRRFHCT